MGPIGHCAVGLAAKPVASKVPLWVLLLATMILDVLATGLVWAGIEGVKTVHDHLCWVDAMSGMYLNSPEDDDWAKAS